MRLLLICVLTALLSACVNRVMSDPFAATNANDARSLSVYLDRGGDPDAKSTHGESLVYIATGPNGGKDVLRLLLERGANPNLGASSYSPLMNASSWCWLEGVTLLAEAGADLNARDERGHTALETVCIGRDRDKVVAYLTKRVKQ